MTEEINELRLLLVITSISGVYYLWHFVNQGGSILLNIKRNNKQASLYIYIYLFMLTITTCKFFSSSLLQLFEMTSNDMSAQALFLSLPATIRLSSLSVAMSQYLLPSSRHFPGTPPWWRSPRLLILWMFPRFPKLATFTIDASCPLRLGILCMDILGSYLHYSTFILPESVWRASVFDDHEPFLRVCAASSRLFWLRLPSFHDLLYQVR